MGKWSEVKCNCPNRVPVDPNRVLEPYQCGHVEGVLLGVWPGYFLEVGRFLKRLSHDPDYQSPFEIFPLLHDSWTHWTPDEYLGLTTPQRDAWRLEIEELLRAEAGESVFPSHIGRRWTHHWSQFFQSPWRRKDGGSITEILKEGIALCEASEKTGNPVEFFW